MNFTSLLEAMQTGFDWTWHTSLGASVLIALVLLVQWLGGKRLPARAAYALWMLVMLRLIMPAVPASRMSIFNLHPAPAVSDIQPVTSIPLSAPSLSVPEVGEKTALPAIPNAAIAPVASFDWRKLAPLAWPAGALSFVALALVFHLRTLRKLRNELPITDSRITALMEECRAKIGVRAEIPMLSAAFLHTPAVFGWWRARILLPPEMVACLETRELRMVLLHELVHIKRHDVLLNWIVIVVRAVHWFNPLVWLAVKRLRAERELICDRRVLALLEGEEERRCYGETLLKLLSGFSRPALNPSLVPLLTNKQTLIRRITMIAVYRPVSRVAVVVVVALLALLCCLTFTRAAAQTSIPRTVWSPTSTPGADSNATVEARPRDPKLSTESRGEGIKILEQQVQEQDRRVRDAEQQLNKLRSDLHLSDEVVNAVGTGVPPGTEKIKALDKAQMECRSTLYKERSLVSQLEKLTRDALRYSILVVYPDPVLTSALRDLDLAESKLVALTNNLGLTHGDVLSARVQVEQLRRKTDVGIDGIMLGLRIKVRALEAQDEALVREVEETKAGDIKQSAAVQEYYREKRNLEGLQKFRDLLAMKLAQLKVDAVLPKTVEAGRVYIFGQVRNQGPIEIPIEENFTVGKAIMRAGGFGDQANKKKVRLVRTAPDGTKQTIELNMEEILERGKTEQDKTLQRDDFIIVPDRVTIF